MPDFVSACNFRSIEKRKRKKPVLSNAALTCAFAGQGYDRVFKYLEARVVNSSKSSRKRTYGELVAQTPGDLRSPAATAANRASLLPDFW